MGSLLATGAALAAALGVHRNTVSACLKAGAPATKPYDELQWRVWMAAHEHDAPRDPEPALFEQLAKLGLPRYQRSLRPASLEPVKPPGADGVQLAMSLEDATAQNRAVIAWVEAEERLRKFRLASRQLVSVEQLGDLVDAIGKTAALGFDDLPNVANEFTAKPEDQGRLRALVAGRVRAARERVSAAAAAELAKFLAPS